MALLSLASPGQVLESKSSLSDQSISMYANFSG
jgi:hypothetical protein